MKIDYAIFGLNPRILGYHRSVECQHLLTVDISCYLNSMHKGRPKTSKKVKSETRVLEFFHFNKKIDIINFCSKESRIILAKIGCTVHAFWNFLVVCVSLSKEYFITRVAFQNGKRPIWKQVAIDFGTDWGYCLAIVATLRLMLLLSICQPMSHLKQDRRTNPFMVDCTQQVVSV